MVFTLFENETMDYSRTLVILIVSCLPWWCLHHVEGLFSWVRELACVTELDSHANSSLAAGRATHAKNREAVLQKAGQSPIEEEG
jgi:hypothetical protein